MRRLAPALILLLAGAAFLAFFHPATLDVGNPGWLIRGTDNGENALGAHAYWHDARAGASLRTRLLNAPDGVPVLFTDSNPLLTLAAKPFAALLPADAQLAGPFILLCLVVQALFAWLLLRRHAPGQVALWAGVVLLAFPPTLFNRYIHVNLMAHWTILAALWLFLDPYRGRQLRWWAPLIAVTALIHSYLLVMVGAIWASAILARLLEGPRRQRIEVIGESVAVLAMVALLARWLGVEGQTSSGYFGHFSMPLDALWNAGVPAYSTLLPAHEDSPGRGFEGFHYLGAGGLLLIGAAVVVARMRSPEEQERSVKQRARALLPALVVLAMLAVSRLPLPPWALALLDPVRASGRLFWPMGYVLVLMALLAVYRLSGRGAGLLLVAMVAIQAVDLSGMAVTIRAGSAEAGTHRLYTRTIDPRWDALVTNARSIAFMPGQDVTRDLHLYQEVAWRAAKLGRPVTAVYAARTSPATARRVAMEDAAFARGELVPGRLYVLFADAPQPPVAAARMHTLDDVTVIVP